MKQKMAVAASVGFLLVGLVAGCETERSVPETEEAPTVEAPETQEPTEPAEEPTEDPDPAPQEEWEENFFATDSGVTCGFLYRDDGMVDEYLCYLPDPTFSTTDGIGEPIDCGEDAYVIDAVLDSEANLYCATEPTPVGLIVAPGEPKEQDAVTCTGVGSELQCSFPYWEKGMGIEVSNNGFIAYMQEDATHNPGTGEGKEYFLPIPFRPVD